MIIRLLLGLRALGLLVGCAAATTASGRLAAPAVLLVARSEAPLRLPLASLLAATCGVALLGCVGWLIATTLLTLASYVARLLAPRSPRVQRLSRRVEAHCPLAVRRLVSLSLGAALTVGLAGPAAAAPPGDPGLRGLRLPDRVEGTTLSREPVRTVVPRVVPTTTHGHPGPAVVVVRRGDSLWEIASRLLPAEAPDAVVDGAWHRLHDANRDRLGPDPDLILPGTRLVVPDLTSHRKDAP